MTDRTAERCGVVGALIACGVMGAWTYDGAYYAAHFVEISGLPLTTIPFVVYGSLALLWMGGLALEAVIGYQLGRRLALTVAAKTGHKAKT